MADNTSDVLVVGVGAAGMMAALAARGAVERRGAMPCLDLIGLEEYLAELQGLDIAVFAERSDAALPKASV